MIEINGLNERIANLKMQYQEAERINLKNKATELLVDINYLEELRELRNKQELCEDAVSRKTIDQNIYDYAESNGLSYANLKNAILDAPSVTLTQKWIPVTERLPKKEGFYLVTRRITNDVATFIFRRTQTSKDYWKRCVAAWMPLPKPYKQEIEDKE